MSLARSLAAFTIVALICLGVAAQPSGAQTTLKVVMHSDLLGVIKNG